MKKITLFFIALIFVELASAQITFQKTYGGTDVDIGWFVQQTTDGGYIITGATRSSVALNDIYLIKTNANGDTLWTKKFGGAAEDKGYSVQQTTDGGYIITGYTESFGGGNEDVYLIKTDANGNSLWSKTFGGTSYDRGNSVQQTTDGGYLIAGYTFSFGAGSDDVYLIKTDANGDSLWTKTFGGIYNDVGMVAKQTTDGGYIVLGSTYNFGAGDYDVYLIKTDTNGNLLWTKTFGGTSGDIGNSIQQTTDGGYIIAGITSGFGVYSTGVYLIKTDSNGNLLWTKIFDGINDDWGNYVLQTTDGGYIITGVTNFFSAGYGDLYLLKTNANGDSLWAKSFGGVFHEEGKSVQQTMDGGYIITGIIESFGAGSYDVYLIKTDSLGNSGCNEGNTATTITSPATQVSNPATIVTSPSTIVTTPATIVGSGGTVTTLCTTVGINEIATDNYFVIFPNPSADKFIISFEGTIMKGKVVILNTLGENVFTENILNESRKEINLKNISHGIYFVKVFDGEKSYCKKLIVEHD